jgi:hypothetical protein
MGLKSLKDVVAANNALLTSYGMKADTETVLQNAFDAITTKSNEQSSYQQQRKAFTSANKGIYRAVCLYK